MKKAQELFSENNTDLMIAGGKSSVGFAGSFAAMTINDIAGLLVAVLTGVYMVLQIESALRKRKADIVKEKASDGS